VAVVVPAAAAALLAADIAETVLIQIVGQLVSSTIGAALAPELLELQQESFKLTNTRALDPPLSIDAYIRGYRTEAQSKDDVAASGFDGESWQAMANTAGQPLPLQLAFEAWRRGIIPKSGPADGVNLEQAIRESDLKNKYIGTVEALQYQLPPIGVVIEGWLRAQIDQAAALKYADQQGVTAEVATLMFKAAGRPFGPQELLQLYHRGLIPKSGRGGDTLSLEQGFLETDLKDKWLPLFEPLGDYIPPPRTITALLREGAITEQQAAAWFADHGLKPETVTAYVASAHHQRTAASKELAKADVLALYAAKLLTTAQATQFLEAEGYAAETVAYELEVADFREHNRQLSGVLGRIRSLYIAHKITKDAAMQALTDLGLEPSSRDAQLAAWAVAAQNNVAILTPAQIGGLVKLGWLAFDTGAGLLEGHGYSPNDAALFLVEHLKLAPGDPQAPPGLSPS
jgi:hypothetical protein